MADVADAGSGFREQVDCFIKSFNFYGFQTLEGFETLEGFKTRCFVIQATLQFPKLPPFDCVPI